MKRSKATLLTLLLAAAAAGAQAQQDAVLVNVDLGTVANTIARNINVDVEQVPASLRVPVGVAASVCGVPAAKLAPGAGAGAASCQAVNTTAALDQVVQKQLKAQAKQ